MLTGCRLLHSFGRGCYTHSNKKVGNILGRFQSSNNTECAMVLSIFGV